MYNTDELFKQNANVRIINNIFVKPFFNMNMTFVLFSPNIETTSLVKPAVLAFIIIYM